MHDQLLEIGRRLSEIRLIKGISVEDISAQLGVSTDEYLAYENGDNDFSFSFLYNVAEILEVDVSNIMSGHSPKLSACSIVRSGKGLNIKKENRYEYKPLAYTFKDKFADPFLVTVEPDNDTPKFHSHDGQEFNYVTSGKMQFFIDDIVYTLNKGDSVYFDASIPHAEKCLGDKPLKFVAVVINNGK